MEGLNALLAVALGLVLRIGIPMAVTAGVVYLLRCLDQRWQREAAFMTTVAPTGKPCWEVKGCAEEKRKKCPAAAQPEVPCWQVFRSRDGRLRESCLGCDMFRQAPMPSSRNLITSRLPSNSNRNA